MKTIKINSLVSLMALGQNKALVFKPDGKTRKVEIELSTSGPVDIFAKVRGVKKDIFVASGDGHFAVAFAVSEKPEINILRDPDTVVSYRLKGVDQTTAKTSNEKFTSIERRRSRNPELDMMMMLMKHNQEQMDIKLEQEIAKVRNEKAQNNDEVAEKPAGQAGRQTGGTDAETHAAKGVQEHGLDATTGVPDATATSASSEKPNGKQTGDAENAKPAVSEK